MLSQRKEVCPTAAKVKRKSGGFIQKGRPDYYFLALVLILLTLGLIMLFSASYSYALSQYGNSYRFIGNQLFFAALGVGVMFLFSRINYNFWRRLSWPLYIVCIALLVLLLVLPTSAENTDAKRWFSIGGLVSFQPSELTKLAVILLFSSLIAAHEKKMRTFRYGVLFFLGLIAVPCVLIYEQPHLSALILIFAIGVVLMIAGGVKLWHLALGLAGIVAVAAAYVLTQGGISYVGTRFEVLRDPWSDPLGKGMQTIQSLLAIGSGGLFGRGFGQSRQKYQWVPDPHNDFIFSIWCEEFGLLGALLLIAVFVMLVWRGFDIAMRSPDKFGSCVTLGLSFQVGLQTLLNICVVTNLMPNTGISLPFFSYGGSSLIILLAEMGIVLSVSRAASEAERAKAAEAAPTLTPEGAS